MRTALTAEPRAKKSKPDVSPDVEPAPPSAFQLEAATGSTAGLTLFLALGLQRKLSVGAEDDPLEREADRVAERVMRSTDSSAALASEAITPAAYPHHDLPFSAARLRRKCACGGNSSGECEECRKREAEQPGAPAIQRHASGNGNGGGATHRLGGHGSDAAEAPAIVHEALRSSGQPLDSSVRPFMESRFSRDFSDVRVHTDSVASKSAQAVNALAYTAGSDVVFAPGQYSPRTREGTRLLAHELTHVVQQGVEPGARRPPLVQRQPDATPAPMGPPIAPEDRQTQIYAATVLRQVPAPDPATSANLGKALSFAPVYEDIQERNRVRDEVQKTKDDLDRATNEVSIKSYNVHDVSGAPGGTGPGSGEPEKAATELAAAQAEKARLKTKLDSLTQELQLKDALVKKELAGLGVKDENELLNFVDETFPNTFIDRGKQIAIAQLEANKRAAQKERERYKATNPGVDDRKGLKDACRDLNNRTLEITAIWRSRTTTLPPGGADPNDPGVQEWSQVQDKVTPKQQELDKKRAEYQLKYPILFKLDAQQVAEASDSQLDAVLDGPIKVVLDNIDSTESNINGGSLKIWKLKASGIDVPRLTKSDMGIRPGSTLDKVVDKKAADDKSPAEMITDALNALSLVADAIALVTGPIGVAVAAGITAVAAVANVVQDYQTYTATLAAGNVAIDPDAAKMAQEQPDLEGLIFSLAMAGISALAAVGAIRNAVNTYRRVRTVAKDLDSFKNMIRETALDETVKEKLIAEATSQYAKSPVVDLKLLKAEFAAIGTTFSTAEKVSVARILKTFGEEATAKSFLEMAETKIFKLTPEAIETAYAGNPGLIASTKAEYFGGAKRFSRGFTDGAKVFIRPENYSAVTETVAHEIVHALQNRHEPRLLAKVFAYNREMQAFRKQREFLQHARDTLGEATFNEAFRGEGFLKNQRLVDATDEQIAEFLRTTKGYELVPPNPPLILSEEELDEALSGMIDKEEMKRQAFNAAARQLGPR